MSTPEQEEEWAEWMRAGMAGDAAAYRRVLQALAPALRGTARRGFARAGLPVEEAEDVVQEVLLAIHLKRHSWDPARPLGPWLAAITRNKLIDALRRRAPARRQVPIDDLTEELASPPAADPDRQREVDRLLGRLGGRQRAVVQAVSLEGASAREAAERLSMSEGAVRVTLHRALKALASLYGELPA